MNKTIIESIETITKLNELYFKQTKDEYNIPFKCAISCNAYSDDYVEITFNDLRVWSTEYEDMLYNNETDEFEPIFNYIKRWYMNYRKSILNFKL